MLRSVWGMILSIFGPKPWEWTILSPSNRYLRRYSDVAYMIHGALKDIIIYNNISYTLWTMYIIYATMLHIWYTWWSMTYRTLPKLLKSILWTSIIATSTWGSVGNRTRDPLHCDQVFNLLNHQNPLGGSSANSSLVGTKLQSTWPISQIPCFFCMFWSSHKALHL